MGFDYIIDSNDLILVTGANGFVGARVVETLLSYEFANLRCFVRPSGNWSKLQRSIDSHSKSNVEVMIGNLLSRDDCENAARGATVIIHLAAGIEKSFPGSFLNSVLTTRNLLDATLNGNTLKRFLNVSSLAVYSNWSMKRGELLDEACQIEDHLVERYEPYVFAKVKQDELVEEYGMKHNIPYVIVRPGAVYGPGKKNITARVGIDTFGLFFHLGGSNRIPITYVDNCAEAIVLASLIKNVDGEVFNIVDDELPTSRNFLKSYKKNVNKLKSVYIPYGIFYLLSYLWERYSYWSEGQLPPVFNRRRCSVYWKGNAYSNEKIKRLLGWKQKVAYEEALIKYYEFQRDGEC